MISTFPGLVQYLLTCKPLVEYFVQLQFQRAVKVLQQRATKRESSLSITENL